MTSKDPREFYRGEQVSEYEAARQIKPQWKRESQVFDDLLTGHVRNGDIVVDVPVGTGRFLNTYAERGLNVLGIDVSPDMVEQASRRATDLGMTARIEVGDATRLGVDSDSATLVVCVRLLTLVDFPTVRAILSEAKRVAPLVITSIHEHPPLLRRGSSLRSRLRALVILGLRAVRGSATRTVTHPASDVAKEIENQRLEVLERHVINTASDGSEYVMYLLRRK